MKCGSNLTDALCTRCGLCCNGSLFADVEITGREASMLETMGLSVDEDDSWLLVQPCAALRGRRCSIYAHRPRCCRTFECKLLQNVQRGNISVEEALIRVGDALRRIERIKELLPRVSDDEAVSLRERCLEALAELKDEKRSGELRKSVQSLDLFLQDTFLGG